MNATQGFWLLTAIRKSPHLIAATWLNSMPYALCSMPFFIKEREA